MTAKALFDWSFVDWRFNFRSVKVLDFYTHIYAILCANQIMPIALESESRFRNSKYYAIPEPTTWLDAEAQAVAFGGHLVTINDTDENQFLWQTYGGSIAFREGFAWIGLNDIANEADFRWSSGEPVVYTNWSDSQPALGDRVTPDGFIYNAKYGVTTLSSSLATTRGKWTLIPEYIGSSPSPGGAQVRDFPAIVEIPDIASFSIEDVGTVTGGQPNGERRISFDLTNSDEVQRWNGRPVWIIVHGWNDTPTRFNTLARTVERVVGSGGLVLTLDWSQAAGTGSSLFSAANATAASWIKTVADYAAQKLKDWGLTNGGNLNFIGHSLGSILSAEVASRFGRVNRIVALEPPSDANIFGGYDIDGSTAGRQAPRGFRDVTNFSRAFVGASSNAASAALASTAHESILMDYGIRSDQGEEHSWVIDTFRQLVDPNNQQRLVNGLFSLNDGFHSEFRQNSWWNRAVFSREKSFEGSIRVDPPNQIVSFTARDAQTADTLSRISHKE